MINYYPNGNFTVGGSNAATLTNVIYTTNTSNWQPYAAVQVVPGAVAVIPDTPEAWLRQRVKEVCDLAKAA